jgi:acetylornithine deacetylase/succinyl-diaminopimelate desuccinylase-like protein
VFDLVNPLSYVNEKRVVELVEELVSINSVTNHEQEISNWVAEHLDGLGLGVERLHVEESGDTIVGWIDGSSGNSKMMLNFHMDTFDVFRGWKTDPFKPVIKDRRLYGLGAHDMKGGAACLLAAVEALVKSNVKLGDNLLVSGTTDEENWSRGAHALIKNGYLKGCKYCLVPEPSASGTLTIGARGRHVFHLKFHGQAVSAAYDGGVNAVVDASKVVVALAELSKKELGFNEEYKIGGTSCVIGFRGGGTMIYVPEAAEIWVDRHILPSQTIEWAADHIRAIVEKAGISGTYELSLDERPTPAPTSFIVSEKSKLIQTVTKNLELETGWKTRHVIARSVADTNHIAVHGGVPTLVCGPTGGNTCEANEWVDIDSLIPTTRVYVRSVMDLVGIK